MSSNIQEIQEDLTEYFKDTDDATFVSFINVFIYFNGTTDSKISNLIDKFLTDFGLVEAFLNYTLTMKEPNKFFMAFPSDVRMIEEIRLSFLSLSFFRLKKVLRNTSVVSKPKTYSTPLVTKLNKNEKDDLKMVIRHCIRENDNLIEGENITRSMFEKDEADELMAERNRLKELFPKVLTILK